MSSKVKTPRGKKADLMTSSRSTAAEEAVAPVKPSRTKALSKVSKKGSAAATMEALLGTHEPAKPDIYTLCVKAEAESVADTNSPAPETPKTANSTVAVDAGLITPISAKASAPPQTASAKKKGAASRQTASSDKENDSNSGNQKDGAKGFIARGAGLRRFQEAQKSNATVAISEKVQKVYKLVHKSTGALGGNGYDGAIYGELTMHSMQKVYLLYITIIKSRSNPFVITLLSADCEHSNKLV
jgi:hypothetical protein